MPFPELDNLVRLRKLKAEPGNQPEFNGLVKSGLPKLSDVKQSPKLGVESRFDLGYNAAHSLALAALRWHGYRPDGRYVVFQCLEHTVGLPAAKWRVLSKAHDKRNLAEYEGALDVEESLVSELLRIADEVGTLVSALGPVPS